MKRLRTLPSRLIFIGTALIVLTSHRAAAGPRPDQDCVPLSRKDFLEYVRARHDDEHLANLIERCGIEFPVDAEILQIVEQRSTPHLPNTLARLKRLMAQKRVTISMFKYIEISGCSDLTRQYTQFKALLMRKRDRLISLYSGDRYEYLNRIQLEETGVDYSIFQQFEDQMKRADVLQVLYGLCYGNEKGAYMQSQVYLGELAGPLPQKMITIDIANTLKEFSNNRDMHSLLILYALGQDAKKDAKDKEMAYATTKGYLDRARGIALSLKDTEHADQALAIIAAIDETYRQLGISGLVDSSELSAPPNR